MFTTHPIQTATLGEFLKKARQSSGWQLKDIEKRIKISETYLQALEENDYYKLPSPTYAKGFLEHYAGFLGLDPKPVIDRYRKENQFFENKEKVLKNAGLNQKVLPGFRKFIKGQKIKNFDLRKIGTIAIIVAFLFYFVWTISQAISPPKIIIISPANNFETAEKTIKIEGRVKGATTVRINDQFVSHFEKGFFEETVPLAAGENIIKISAKKKHSPETVILRTVIVKE